MLYGFIYTNTDLTMTEADLQGHDPNFISADQVVTNQNGLINI